MKLEPLLPGPDNPDGACFRVRISAGAQFWIRLSPADEGEALARAELCAEQGAKLRRAGVPPAAAKALLGELAGARSSSQVDAARVRISDAVDRPKRFQGTGAGLKVATFGELGDEWTSGRLHARFPDHVKAKKSFDKDEQRLKRLAPVLGKVRLDRFTRDDAKRAMAALPSDLSSTTRRHYAQVISTVLKYAEFPCEIIRVNPLPRNFLPRVAKRKAMAFLYPEEDRALVTCADVPFVRRLFYGFLAREGMRYSEALGLRWRDLDLKRGTVRLDRNKTASPRVWTLTAGVAEALAAFRPPDATFKDLVFPGVENSRMAAAFRRDLKRALGEDARPELFEETPDRLPIRIHDLRSTFVTLALAAGKPEKWIRRRTGHTSSVMLARYDHAAQHAAELELGELERLDALLLGAT